MARFVLGDRSLRVHALQSDWLGAIRVGTAPVHTGCRPRRSSATSGRTATGSRGRPSPRSVELGDLLDRHARGHRAADRPRPPVVGSRRSNRRWSSAASVRATAAPRAYPEASARSRSSAAISQTVPVRIEERRRAARTVVAESQLGSTGHGLVRRGRAGSSSTRATRSGGTRKGRGSSASSRARASRAPRTSCSSGPTSPCSRRASRWRCTTGRQTRRTSSCSPERRSPSSKVRSARYVSGIFRTALPESNHVIIGSGEALCLVLAVGARDRSVGPDWGAYTVDETALTPRRGRRARDDRFARGVCPLLPERADALSRGLAARPAVGGNGGGRAARRRVLQEC